MRREPRELPARRLRRLGLDRRPRGRSPSPASAASGGSSRRGSSGLRGSLPKRYRGVSFDRPPISDMAREPGLAQTVAADPRALRADRRGARRGRGRLADGGRRDRARRRWRCSSRRRRSRPATASRSTRCRACSPGSAAPTTPSAGEEGYLSFFNRLTSVDLLHLDDLGAEKRTDWVLEQLYAIVDRRYEEQRSMVVTTNLEDVGARGADRRAHGLAAGRDLRRPAAALRRRPAHHLDRLPAA